MSGKQKLDEMMSRMGTDGKEGTKTDGQKEAAKDGAENEKEHRKLKMAISLLIYLLGIIMCVWHHAINMPTYLVIMLMYLWIRITSENTKPYDRGKPCIGFPKRLMILSSIMWSMEFVGYVLKFGNLKWSLYVLLGYYSIFVPYLRAMEWFVNMRKAPDKVKKLTTFVRKSRSKEGHINRQKLLMMVLMVAIHNVNSTPHIALQGDKALKRSLRRKRKRNGQLNTLKLNETQRNRVMQAVSTLPDTMVVKGDIKPIVLDTGASNHATGSKEDFVEGTLEPLHQRITMDGIGATMEATHGGLLRYEFVMDDGTLGKFEGYGLYLPNMTCRLFSPQAYLSAYHAQHKRRAGTFSVDFNNTKFLRADGKVVTIPYDKVTRLPILQAFHSAEGVAESLALNCVTSEVNQNLTYLQKVLLQWHFKLGHVGFQNLQWIGRQGWIGKLAVKMGSTSVNPPKCAACLFGRQQRTPKKGSTTTKDSEGALKKDQLNPGDLVFSDQYESRLPGRVFNGRGSSIDSQKYCGGTLFCDAATGKMFIQHQISLTAMETIESKLTFERQAAAQGIDIKTYQTDNGIYTSRQFMAELNEKGQGIKHSGVGGHHHNGVAENGIKIVVYMARTMMIHSALRWPEVSDRELWPLALSHAVHLYNHTPRQDKKMSPEELWSRTKSSHSILINAQPWGCPTYILDPSLQDGKKIPKWKPRSRQAQYMGVSPLHASSVSLVRNLRTGNISPQFHVVHDSWFETVTASEGEQPSVWEELVTFQTFRSEYDDDAYVPRLTDEWLSREEIVERDRQQIGRRESGNLEPPPAQPPEHAPGAEPPPHPPDDPPGPLNEDPAPAADPDPPSTHVPRTGTPRRSGRIRRAPEVLNMDPTQKSYVRALFNLTVKTMMNSSTPDHDYNRLYAMLMDPALGCMDNLIPTVLAQCPQLLKAGKADPDLPTLREAMNGPHRDEFIKAMKSEIDDLEKHETWHTVKESEVPAKADGTKANILPCTWVLRIKRYPDGRLRKFKARICARGDRQIAGVDYGESFAPVVSWSTVRLLLCMSVKLGWETRQVDFSNAFVQASLKEEVYMRMPPGFEEASGEQAVLKLDKSLYGLVQAPKAWFEHLTAKFAKLGLYPSDIDPCLFYGHGMAVLCYVDDCLFFGPDGKRIDKMIKDIEESGMPLTIESEDVYHFLGVEVDPDKSTKVIKMTQKGLIAKVLKLTGMEDCNGIACPASPTPLGSDLGGKAFDQKEYEYAQVVGMLMYLSTNTRPDIQFAVHQCARFTHNPKESHGVAIKKIIRYLAGTRDKGIEVEPTDDLKLDLYVDADFAGLWNHEDDQDPVCVKSRTGYVLTLGTFPLHWVSKLQSEISLSTCEAEYIALSQAMRDLLPMRRLLLEIGQKLELDFSKPAIVHSTIFEDNTCALGLAQSPRMTPRTKHIGVKYHFFRSWIGVAKGILIEHVDTLHQKADIFTKGLPGEKFQVMRKMLMGW